jgi:glycosyltransferase involved in cell wall biosynthesis
MTASSAPAPLVSVIVTTRNCESTVGRCLETIRAQTVREIEVIVVDNHSTDGTRAIAERLADLVIVAGPERSSQRNVGLAAARGGYVLVLDCDMELQPDVVAACLECVGDGAAIVAIPEISFGEGYWSRCKAFERSFYNADAVVAAARFFPTAVLRTIGGWDEEMYAGEDWDVSMRAEALAPMRFARTHIRHNEGRLRLSALLAKKHYYGRNLRVFLRKHRSGAMARLSPMRGALLREWRVLLSKPTLTIGMLAMKAGELAAVGTGMLRSPKPVVARARAEHP